MCTTCYTNEVQCLHKVVTLRVPVTMWYFCIKMWVKVHTPRLEKNGTCNNVVFLYKNVGKGSYPKIQSNSDTMTVH